MGDDLRPRHSEGRHRALLQLGPAIRRASRVARARAWTNPISRYYADCAAGTLPNIAIVDPPFRDGGGGDGLSADEHPLGDVRLGQAFMADVVNAFVRSPNYRKGALFVIYDEWGGFFDHVRPPRVVDDRASRDQNEDFAQMGFRIPAVTVSPYTRRRGERLSGRPRRLRPRVDPQADLLPLRPRLPEQAPPLRPQHRPQLRLGGAPDFDPVSLPDPARGRDEPVRAGGRRHRRQRLRAGTRQRPRLARGSRLPLRRARLRGQAARDLPPAGHRREGDPPRARRARAPAARRRRR